MPSLKLITLNVETNKHWARILPFLEREQADVVCMQELFESDLDMLKKRFGYQALQIPSTMKYYDSSDPHTLQAEGPALMSRLPLAQIHAEYYYRPTQSAQIYYGDSLESKRATISQGIVWASLKKGTDAFTIATTHFTWTPDGKPSAYQEQDLEALFRITDKIPDMVFCGDFNAPRGEENIIYRRLALRFKDNVPRDIPTTIDLERHYAGQDIARAPRLATFVVDYIFSTPGYQVSDVRPKFGVSDHCALIATISR